MSEDLEIKKIVGQIAAAYFGNNHVTPTEIPAVISQIASSIAAVGVPASEAPVEALEQTKLTAAQIRRSVTRDAIISFEDNKPYKTLRRHLASRGTTPDEYRSKWGLPRDYPMVAPAYSETRSNLAKERGLGGRVRANTPAPARQRQPSGARPTVARVAAAQAAPEPSVRDAKASAGAEGRAKGRRKAPARSRRTKNSAASSGAAD